MSEFIRILPPALIAGMLGIYAISELRRMMRTGVSRFLFDWRRLMSKRSYEFQRQNAPAQFWIAIFFNSFFSAITLAMALIMSLMLLISIAFRLTK